MCGRNSIGYRPKDLSENYGIERSEIPDFQSSWNVCPEDETPMVTVGSGMEAKIGRWSFVPGWASRKQVEENTSPLINARLEEIDATKAFRDAWSQNHRCIIPSTGFYEWKEKRGGKQPYFVSSEQKIFGMAGLYSVRRNRGSQVLTYCILTETADGRIRELHERQPVTIPKNKTGDFLSGALSKKQLLEMEGVQMNFHPVSREVNSPDASGKELTKKPTSLEDF